VRRPSENCSGNADALLLSRVCNLPSACRGERRDPSSGQAFCWGDPSTQQGLVVERSLSSSSGLSGSVEGDDAVAVPATWHKTLRDPACNTPGSPRPWRPELTVPDAPPLMTARRRNAIRRSLSEPPQEFLSFREQAERFAHGSRASPALVSRALSPAASPGPRQRALSPAASPALSPAASPQAAAATRYRSPSRSLTVPQAPALATEGRSFMRSLETSVGGGRPTSPMRRGEETSVRGVNPAASPAARSRMSPKASPKTSPRVSPRNSPRAPFPGSSPRASPRSSPRAVQNLHSFAEAPRPMPRSVPFAFRAQIGDKQPWQAMSRGSGVSEVWR